MSHLKLEHSIFESLRNHWRIKAALATYRMFSTYKELDAKLVSYRGIPYYGVANNFIIDEDIDQAINQIHSYSKERLVKDTFLILLSHTEEFFSDAINNAGQVPSGTFGSLQYTIQSIHPIAITVIEDLDEIRERRNALIHHNGKITPKYILTANKVYNRSNSMVANPKTVTSVDISDEYLSYVADVVIRYSRFIP